MSRRGWWRSRLHATKQSSNGSQKLWHILYYYNMMPQDEPNISLDFPRGGGSKHGLTTGMAETDWRCAHTNLRRVLLHHLSEFVADIFVHGCKLQTGQHAMNSMIYISADSYHVHRRRPCLCRAQSVSFICHMSHVLVCTMAF